MNDAAIDRVLNPPEMNRRHHGDFSTIGLADGAPLDRPVCVGTG